MLGGKQDTMIINDVIVYLFILSGFYVCIRNWTESRERNLSILILSASSRGFYLKLFFDFYLNLKCSGIGRKNLVLRHSVLHFPQDSQDLYVEWRSSTPRFAMLPERGDENIKYCIPPNGIKPTVIAFTVHTV